MMAGAAAISWAAAGDPALVIGDSLSKEYEVEFPGLYPDQPEAWDSRNWAEILQAERRSRFDMGRFGFYFDFRVSGHEFNVAKPGGTAREYRNFLRQDDAAEREIRASSNGDFYWSQFPRWRETFNDLLGQADKAVLFLGGNDLALGNSDPQTNVQVGGRNVQVEYRTIYDGGPGEAGDPDRMRHSIRGNLRSVVQYLRNNRGWSRPLVICSVPHVGATPKIQQEVGTDPQKTARVTAMLTRLRDELRAQADEFGAGFADIYALTLDLMAPGPYHIGGIRFFKEPDPEARPRYLFSGDGFHPNTPAQAKMAQIILEAFRQKYPSSHGAIPPLTDREIIIDVLGLDPSVGFREWIESSGVPAARRGPLDDPDGDGLPNLSEYALAGLDPARGDGAPQAITQEAGSGRLLLTWRPRFADCAWTQIVPQRSSDLRSWTDISPGSIESLPDGSRRAAVSPAAAPQFLRLSVRVR